MPKNPRKIANDVDDTFRKRLMNQTEPEITVYPEEDWGTVFEVQPPGSGCATEAERAPEGLVLVTRCKRCGDRLETLTDLRAFGSRNRLGTTINEPEIVKALRRADEHRNRWATKHRCGSRGRSVPPRVLEILNAEIAEARALLQTGEPVPGLIYLLLSNGDVVYLGVSEHSERGPWNPFFGTVVPWLKFKVRESLRELKLTLTAVVLVAEAKSALGSDGLPSIANAGHEQLLACVLTPASGRLTLHPIRRDTGLCGLGPATVGPGIAAAAKDLPLLTGFFARPV
jgi:hypothetical protein